MVGLKQRLRAAVERDRQKHYNSAGQRDAFSDLIQNRLASLGLSQSEFALKTEAVLIQSDATTREALKKVATQPALVCRAIKGTRTIPLGRVLTWASVLGVRSEKQVHAFLDLVLHANALRDVRRLVHTRNPTKKRLVKLLDDALNASVRRWDWNDRGRRKR